MLNKIFGGPNHLINPLRHLQDTVLERQEVIA